MTFETAFRLYREGELVPAKGILERLLKTGAPRNEVRLLLGNIHIKLGELEKGADLFAASAHHDKPKARELLLNALNIYGRLNNTEKIAETCDQALATLSDPAPFIQPGLDALFKMRAFERMEPFAARADLNDFRQLILVANYHRLTRTIEGFYDRLRAFTRANPGNALALSVLYTLARELFEFEALAEFDKLMEDPDSPIAREVIGQEPPLGRRLWSDDPKILMRPDTETGKYQALPRAQRRTIGRQGDRLRIGYLSNDFFDHPTMVLIRDVFSHHDRDRFEITLFCHTARNDAERDQPHWPQEIRDLLVPVGHLSDPEIAAEISRRDIDILVDLKGHTLYSRLGAVALSDAPVKVTWLGFPGSVRGADIDYAIADGTVVEEGEDAFFEEKLCRLPHTYQPNWSHGRALPNPPKRADLSLPKNAIVFASFNTVSKWTLGQVKLWIDVLRQVDGAVFWTLGSQTAIANLQKLAEQSGVDPQRIVAAPRLDHAGHIDRLAAADIVLDCFPYNGHTSTSDSLWAGVPVVTKSGRSFASRVAASLLRAHGVPDLICRSDDEYVALAVRLAGDPVALEKLRETIRAHRHTHPLFDSLGFTRALEAGYLAMAERARRSLPPEPISVTA